MRGKKEVRRGTRKDDDGKEIRAGDKGTVTHHAGETDPLQGRGG